MLRLHRGFILNRECRHSLLEKVSFGRRLERGEIVSHVDI